MYGGAFHMSTEWFIQAHSHGNDQPICTGLINRCFAGYECSFNDGSVDVIFDRMNSSAFFFAHTDAYASALTISRPCLHPGLTEIVFRIMSLGNFVLYAPGAKFPIVLAESVPDELPHGMTDAIGSPEIAKTRPEFDRLISSLYG